MHTWSSGPILSEEKVSLHTETHTKSFFFSFVIFIGLVSNLKEGIFIVYLDGLTQRSNGGFSFIKNSKTNVKVGYEHKHTISITFPQRHCEMT